MKYLAKSFSISAVVFLALPLLVQGVYAATLRFNPTTTTVDTQGTFDVEILVDSGSDEISGTDAYVLYDASVLQPQSVEEGDHFPTVTNTISSDRVSISGVITDPTDFRTGEGTLATITFEALSAGTTDLEIYCDLSANDTSKIVKSDINATNIIECNALQNFTATINDNTPTATPQPQPTTPPATPVPTSVHVEPTALPEAGIADNIAQYTIPGVILLMVGGIVRFVVFK
jgi:hypothetical protein